METTAERETWRAADGTSYEGKGIPPDLVIQNQRAVLEAGRDQALEMAIDLLPQ